MNNEPVAWMFKTKQEYGGDVVFPDEVEHTKFYYAEQKWNYELIPLYTHPAKTLRHENHDWDRGTWTVGQTESQEFIESSDFNHDVRLYLNGDFETDTQRLNYLQHIADRLNTHPANTLTDEEINVVAILQDAEIVPLGHEIWKTGEEFNKYKKIVLATAKALRKAQEK